MTDHLDVLISDGVIDEVLGRLKSGKEANISLIRRGDAVLAAKVYKDRSTRSFKNNADYKEGRKVRNSRTQRAMDSGGKFGRDAAEQAWKSAEADALYKLVDAGVRVPTPVMFYEGVLLMELVKDVEGRPAPRLIDVALEPEAALRVYADLVAQIIAMLCCDLIHGDLSPYNILAAADGPTIIDFPQVVSAVHSSRAEFFFLRDFDNVVRFVSGFDPRLAVHRHDGRAIWRAYVARELTREFVPPPPPPPQSSRGGGNRYERRFDERRPDAGGRGAPPQRYANGSAAERQGPQQGPGTPGPRSAPPGSRQGPRSGPPGPQGPRSGPPGPWSGAQGPRTEPPRGHAQAPSHAAPRHAAAPKPREWSMPAAPPSAPKPSRGGRRRPKRRW